jgi:hypothetical protein
VAMYLKKDFEVLNSNSKGSRLVLDLMHESNTIFGISIYSCYIHDLGVLTRDVMRHESPIYMAVISGIDSDEIISYPD